MPPPPQSSALFIRSDNNSLLANKNLGVRIIYRQVAPCNEQQSDVTVWETIAVD